MICLPVAQRLEVVRAGMHDRQSLAGTDHGAEIKPEVGHEVLVGIVGMDEQARKKHHSGVIHVVQAYLESV